MDENVTLEEAQELAVRRHPTVAPFKDLLVGESVEAIDALAEDIANRIEQGEQVTAPADEAGSGDFFSGFAPLVQEAVRPDYVQPERDAHGLPPTTQDRWNAFFAGLRGGD